jgi:hypothetical protein
LPALFSGMFRQGCRIFCNAAFARPRASWT